MPPAFPRLTRQQVLEGLRRHAAKHGYASHATLRAHDPTVLRSIRLYFVGLDAARHAARIAGPPISTAGAKRGPKPGSWRGRGAARAAFWTRERVLNELRRLHRAGKSTRLDDLVESRHISLVHAANTFAGGLVAARAAAKVPQPPRRTGKVKADYWTEAKVATAIRRRRRRGLSLASSRVPQTLFRAARYQFGSWPAALTALDIDPREARVYRTVYSKDEILRRLRAAARAGSDLRSVSLKGVVDAKAIHREFGTLAAAISAAGLDAHLSRRKHGGQKWSPERVIAVLRERAARGEHTLTSNLHQRARAYFGSADGAREAAGVPSPIDLRMEARRRRLARERRARR